MIVTPLRPERIGEVLRLMELGEPYISARTLSDYWLYATLFSSTCPIAIDSDDTVTGAAIASVVTAAVGAVVVAIVNWVALVWVGIQAATSTHPLVPLPFIIFLEQP